ncbi:MAG: hypothetical protein KGN36_22010, partial [Acidobacteriota bacterium]|nr:hypothetical protein [Acidobacteriota bacterium]
EPIDPQRNAERLRELSRRVFGAWCALLGAEKEIAGEAGEDVPEHWGRPACPRCGWSNTRPAMSRTLGDRLLRVFALRPFRCRSCGKRFRALRRRESKG